MSFHLQMRLQTLKFSPLPAAAQYSIMPDPYKAPGQDVMGKPTGKLFVAQGHLLILTTSPIVFVAEYHILIRN